MKDLNLIELTDLEKRYGKKEALTGINLTIGRGKIIGLLGPNGSGKTTLIKLLNGLLQPTSGEIKVNGKAPGIDSKKIISYLPDKMYFADWMKISDLMDFFEDFYEDFDRKKAEGMCDTLKINTEAKIKSLSKGNKEKVQLVLVMCRKAQLYLLDEPIAGVDPAARDFILDTILNNYNEEGTVIISTHLIADIEKIMDEVIFIKEGNIVTYKSADDLREESGKSIDALFREIFHTDVFIEQNDQAAGEFRTVKCIYHAAAFIKAVPTCAEQAGMSDGRIIRKQSACVGQLAILIPHIKGIEQLFFHAVSCPRLIPLPQLGKSVILKIILGNQLVIGAVHSLENKLVQHIGRGNHAFIADADIGFHDTVRFIVIRSRPSGRYGQDKDVLAAFPFRSKDKTRIGRNPLFDQTADRLCVGLRI